MRRVGTVVVLAAVLMLAIPLPARADAARPSNYRSEVTEIEPAIAGLEAEVAGGDSFLRITAAPGVEVVVPGYEGEAYLEFRTDGSVFANQRSETHWINQDRNGTVTLPAGVSNEAAPSWEQVAGDGTYAFHDHRIHWMAPAPPPGIDQAEPGTVQDWSVPVVVDGEDVTISGVLSWVPAVSPWPWALGAALALALLVATGTGRWGLVAAAVAGLAVGGSQALATLGLAGDLLSWVAPAIALVAAGVGLVRRSWTWTGLGAVVLGVWAVGRIATLWLPVLPSPLPGTVERLTVALALAAPLAALFEAYRRLGLPPRAG